MPLIGIVARGATIVLRHLVVVILSRRDWLDSRGLLSCIFALDVVLVLARTHGINSFGIGFKYVSYYSLDNFILGT